MPEIMKNEWFLKNLPADLLNEKRVGNQFEERDQPMQSIDTIMQIISEATVPVASLDQFMSDNSDIDDDIDDFDSDYELDVDSSGEIVYAI